MAQWSTARRAWSDGCPGCCVACSRAISITTRSRWSSDFPRCSRGTCCGNKKAMQLDWPILSVLIWLPIFGGVVMLALGRWIALLTTAATFGISTLLWVHFDSSTALMQFTEERTWIDIPGTCLLYTSDAADE